MDFYDSKPNMTQNTPKTCPICNLQVCNIYNLKRHIEIIHGDQYFYCAHCLYKTKDKNALVNHLLYTHELGGRKLKCKLCGKLFNRPYSLQRHENTHLRTYKVVDRSYIKNKLPINIPKGPIFCHICNKKVANSYSLNRHMISIHGDQIFNCILCKYTTKDKYALKKHMIRKHNNNKYECNLCKKLFKRESAFKRHEIKHSMKLSKKKKVHKNTTSSNSKISQNILVQNNSIKKEPIICKICNKQVSNSFNLKRHIKVIHGSQYFNCAHCKYQTKDKYGLVKHLLNVHNLEHRKFKCYACGMYLKTLSNLNRHLKTHVAGKKTERISNNVFSRILNMFTR